MNFGRSGQSGNTGYEGYEFLGFRGTYTEVECGGVVRWRECPFEKFGGVVEAEHTVVVFDIVFGEKVVYFLQFR